MIFPIVPKLQKLNAPLSTTRFQGQNKLQFDPQPVNQLNQTFDVFLPSVNQSASKKASSSEVDLVTSGLTDSEWSGSSGMDATGQPSSLTQTQQISKQRRLANNRKTAAAARKRHRDNVQSLERQATKLGINLQALKLNLPETSSEWRYIQDPKERQLAKNRASAAKSRLKKRAYIEVLKSTIAKKLKKTPQNSLPVLRTSQPLIKTNPDLQHTTQLDEPILVFTNQPMPFAEQWKNPFSDHKRHPALAANIQTWPQNSGMDEAENSAAFLDEIQALLQIPESVDSNFDNLG